MQKNDGGILSRAGFPVQHAPPEHGPLMDPNGLTLPARAAVDECSRDDTLSLGAQSRMRLASRLWHRLGGTA